jgi:hypothetical protein
LQTQPTFVPPVKIPPRAPFGPSEVLNAGTPFEGMDLDLQKSAATKSETFVALEHEEKRQYRRMLTCSSRESDAARRRILVLAGTLLSSSALVFGGLSGGDISELGVALLFLLDGSSESSLYLSNTGSAIWLSGESIAADEGWLLLQGVYVAATCNFMSRVISQCGAVG